MGWTGSAMSTPRLLHALLASAALHGTVIVGVPLPRLPEPPPVVEPEAGALVEEEDAGPAWHVPVRVSVVADPLDLALPDTLAAAADPSVAPVYQAPEKKPEPRPKKKAKPEPEPEVVADAAEVEEAAVEPLPEPPPAVEEPAEPDPDEGAVAAPDDDDDGEAYERRMEKKRARKGARGKRKNEKQEPCETTDDITVQADGSWWVERDMIEYYATHMAKLDELGAVWTHKDEAGRPDGFKVGLPRCSLLRQGGLKSGDIVKDINGRRIHNIFQAITAYFALRDERVLHVHVLRKGEPVTLSYEIEKRPRRKDRKKAEREAR